MSSESSLTCPCEAPEGSVAFDLRDLDLEHPGVAHVLGVEDPRKGGRVTGLVAQFHVHCKIS